MAKSHALFVYMYPPKYQQKTTDNVCVASILFLTLHCQDNKKASIVSFLVIRSSDLYNYIYKHI